MYFFGTLIALSGVLPLTKEHIMGRRRTEINISTINRNHAEHLTVTTATEKQYFEKVK